MPSKAGAHPPEQPVSRKREVAQAAASGAAEGAAAGPEGAAAGAAAGAVKSASKSRSSSRSRALGSPRIRVTSKHLLMGEFLTCLLLVMLSPLAKDTSAGSWMKKASGVALLFMVLALVGSTGPKTLRVVSGFGGIVTIAVLIQQRDIFTGIVNAVSGGGGGGGGGPADSLFNQPTGPLPPGAPPAPQNDTGQLAGGGDNIGPLVPRGGQ